MDSFEIYDGSVTPKIKNVFSDSDVARAATLLVRQARERVLDLHAFA